MSQADPDLLRVALTDADPKLLEIALTKAKPGLLGTALTDGKILLKPPAIQQFCPRCGWKPAKSCPDRV